MTQGETKAQRQERRFLERQRKLAIQNTKLSQKVARLENRVNASTAKDMRKAKLRELRNQLNMAKRAKRAKQIARARAIARFSANLSRKAFGSKKKSQARRKRR